MNNAIGLPEKAHQQRFPMVACLKVDPRFDQIRPGPTGFRELMPKVGLQ
jgi:hypothetical protein